MSWLTDINEKNQINMGNSVQKSNKGEQVSWLKEAQTRVTEKINEPTAVQKTLDWVGAAPGKVMEKINDPESQVCS